MTQAWGKVKGREWYQGTPLSGLCHVDEVRRPEQPLSKEETEEYRNILLEACPDSAVALHGKRKRKQPVADAACARHRPNDLISRIVGRTCVPLYTVSESLNDAFYCANVVLTYAESEELCRATVEQNSNQWYQARRVRITASNCYALFTAREKWAEKFEKLSSRRFGGSDATRFGTEHESVARGIYESKSGATVHKCGLVVPPLMPWLGCSPDGIVEQNGIFKLLEIKCPALCEKTSLEAVVRDKKLPFLMFDGENLVLKTRHKYYAQVQLSMTLLDLSSCDLCVFDKSQHQIHIIQVRRDDRYCSELVNKLGNVYFGHILPLLKANSSARV